MHLTKLLVANRGEIAQRVIRTAKALGFLTVAVYSEADAGALHVAMADEAVCVGPPEVGASYLSIDKLIEAATLTGADAVHPGYGFLSENPAFVRACEEAGLVFVGPPAKAMELMGNKEAARAAMEKAGVPCVPGYQGADQTEETFAKEAKRIGFPILIKAAMGGGGRGMRIVNKADELPAALRSARAEALNAFGNGTLLMERALMGARHIEVQVFADSHGNAIHLGERDCSVQRRYQKVIEEAPSPAVNPELRAKLGETAVKAAQACGYTNAGTVEFLLDEAGAFYFLEMNTRLQVEHPVTELVTGTDLVAWQLAVAQGHPLPLTQDEVTLTGHAIEVRLYAEDPAQGYLPQTGRLVAWKPSTEPGVRVDTGIQEGSEVTSHYDPMLAKIIVHGNDRKEACRKLYRALYDTLVLGVTTNKALLAKICQEGVFLEGGATTQYLATQFNDPSVMTVQVPGDDVVGLAGLIHYLRKAAPGGDVLHMSSRALGWPLGSPSETALAVEAGGKRRQLSVRPLAMGRFGQRFGVTVKPAKATGDAASYEAEIEVLSWAPDAMLAIVGGVRRRLRFALGDEETLFLDMACQTYAIRDATADPPGAQASHGSGRLQAMMDGAVMEIFVAPGEQVEIGQVLLVMDAMKMEHPVKSDVKGVVSEIKVQAGAQVKHKQLLVIVAPEEAKAEGEAA